MTVVTLFAAAVVVASQAGSRRAGTAPAVQSAAECVAPRADWIWCDDFERNRLDRYFEYDSADGNFVRAPGVGVGGSTGMRARWAVPGQVGAGSLHLAFGKTPQKYFRPVDAGTTAYRDIYWRMYLRYPPDWVGGGADKLSRAISFPSSTTWAEAMVAHVWSGQETERNFLVLDPTSGTDLAGNLVTTKFNDFANLRWLGKVRGHTPLFAAAQLGQWHCVEARARLSDPGQANGLFELWIDDNLEARRVGLNWVGTADSYGINAVFFENYWNAGSPRPQERYFDNIVVSTQRIGCLRR